MAMTQEHRRRLQVTYVDLLENISQVDRITIGLFSKQVLTRLLKERVEGKKGRQNQLREILDILPKRPDEAFDTFYNLLVENEEDVAADLLCPERAEARKAGLSEGLAKVSLGSTRTDVAGDQTDDPDGDVLPEKWPPDELPDVKDLFRGLDDVRVPKALQTQFKVKFEKAAQSEIGVYPMCREKRGICLIINNIVFHPGKKLNNREGSEADEKGVKELFEKLHFDVQTERNKTAAEMLQIMEKQRTDDHSKYQCFVCFVFTHGKNNGLYGVDGEVASLTKFIGAVDCKSLQEKPKLFFIQACQGGPSDADLGGQGSGDTGNIKSEGGDDPKIEGSEPEGAMAVPDSLGIMSVMTHHGADFYVACATVPECVSYRIRPKQYPGEKDFLGSWFIQAVVHVFSMYSHKRELQNMMTKVNALVRKSKSRANRKDIYQVSNNQNSLEKVLYFFPGLVKA